MKHRIYPRIVVGDENEVSNDEILWIESEEGIVTLKTRNDNGEMVYITPEPVIEPEEPEEPEEPVNPPKK